MGCVSYWQTVAVPTPHPATDGNTDQSAVSLSVFALSPSACLHYGYLHRQLSKKRSASRGIKKSIKNEYRIWRRIVLQCCVGSTERICWFGAGGIIDGRIACGVAGRRAWLHRQLRTRRKPPTSRSPASRNPVIAWPQDRVPATARFRQARHDARDAACGRRRSW